MAKGTAQLYQLQSARPPAVLQLGSVQPSSFGMDATTLGPGYGAAGLFNNGRRVELEFRERYYKCQQHDWKTADFNGAIISSGRAAMVQPLLSTNASTPSFWVPLSKRRPSNPIRIGRKIVGSFTNMLFSHGRWPKMRSADSATQDWAEAIVTACTLSVEMIRARNVGGSCGLVGLSWGWVTGKPCVKVHEGKNLSCLKWVDEDKQIPEHVTELWIFQKEVINRRTGKPEVANFYHRRDWTLLADIVFQDVEIPEKGVEPVWADFIDHDATFIHNHGRIHFEWIANIPDDEVNSDDGQPDYPETYEQQDTLDTLNSVVVRGAILNLDPTLALKVSPEIVNSGVVRKGSDNALILGETGAAEYLELEGTAIASGMALVQGQKLQILETCECVLTDPDKAAAAGSSSVAMKMIYAPMIAKCDILRATYGAALERVLNGLTDFVRCHLPEQPDQQVFVGDAPAPDDSQAADEEIFFDDEGNAVNDNSAGEEAVEFYVDLPPREETVPVRGQDGQPTGEQEIVLTSRQPGQGQISLEWGAYFQPTADDLQKSGTVIAANVGGKPVMSQRTAVELIANMYDRDPNLEWIAVSKETAEARKHELAANSGMWPGTGGGVPSDDPSVPSQEGWQHPDKPDEGALTPQDAKPVLTVNETRQAGGYGPLTLQDGSPNPDGYLTTTEFDAKAAAMGTVGGESAAGMKPDGTITTAPFGGAAEVTPPPKPPTGAPPAPPPAGHASDAPKPPPPSAALTAAKNQPPAPKK